MDDNEDNVFLVIFLYMLYLGNGGYVKIEDNVIMMKLWREKGWGRCFYVWWNLYFFSFYLVLLIWVLCVGKR